MTYQVFVIAEAEEDIVDICRYIAQRDSAEKAGQVAESLKQSCETLAHSPERGHHPPELEQIGVMELKIPRSKASGNLLKERKYL